MNVLPALVGAVTRQLRLFVSAVTAYKKRGGNESKNAEAAKGQYLLLPSIEFSNAKKTQVILRILVEFHLLCFRICIFNRLRNHIKTLKLQSLSPSAANQ
jgi:hypothetical protein